MLIRQDHPLTDDLSQTFAFSLEEILFHGKKWQKTKKQNVVSRSSAKSKYHAIENVTYVLVWIRNLLTELDFALKCPMRLYYDNQATVPIGENPVFHEHTKYIEVDCHLVYQDRREDYLSDMLRQIINWQIYSQTLLRRHKLILFVTSWACMVYMFQLE